MGIKTDLITDNYKLGKVKTHSYIDNFISNKNILIIDNDIENKFIYQRILSIDILESIFKEILKIEKEIKIKSDIKTYGDKTFIKELTLRESFFDSLSTFDYGFGREFSTDGYKSYDVETQEKESSRRYHQDRIGKVYENIIKSDNFKIECPNWVKYMDKDETTDLKYKSSFGLEWAAFTELKTYIRKYKQSFDKGLYSEKNLYPHFLEHILLHTHLILSENFDNNIKDYFESFILTEINDYHYNIHFSLSTLNQSNFFQNNKFLKDFIFGDLSFFNGSNLSSINSSNFDNNLNLFYIDNTNKYSLTENIKNKIKEFNIETIIMNNTENNNINFKSILSEFPKLKIINNETVINYAFIDEKNVLLNSFKQNNELKENQINKTFYTSSNKFYNIDTLKLNEIYLFNYINNMLYKKNTSTVNIFNTNNPFHSSLNNTILNYTFDQKFQDSIEVILKFKNNVKFNIVGLDIEDKNDVLNISNISNNYKYLELFFNKIDGTFVNVNDFSLSWFLSNNDFDKSSKEYFLLDTVLKKYKKDILYLMTEEGKDFKNGQSYIDLRTNFSKTENIFKEEIFNLIDKYVKDRSSSFSLNEKEQEIFNEIKEYTFKDLISICLEKYNILYSDFTDNTESINQNISHVLITLEEHIGFYNQEENIFNNILDIDVKFDKKINLNYSNISEFFKNSNLWFRINYEIDRVFSAKKLFHDIDKILNNENVYNQKDTAFEKLRSKIFELSEYENFKKMKESYGFYLFNKENKVYRLEDKKDYSSDDLEHKKSKMVNWDPETNIFKEITSIENYYTDISLGEDKDKIVDRKDSKLDYYDVIKSTLTEKQKELFNYFDSIESDFKFTKPGDTSNEQFSYYYHHLYTDMKNKLEENIIDIEKASNFLNTIVKVLVYSVENDNSLEMAYYGLKGDSSSLLDSTYLVFKQKEIEELQSLVNYIKDNSYLNINQKEKFLDTTSYIIKYLNENDEDMVMENIYTQKFTKDIEFFYLLIVRIMINNFKSLKSDTFNKIDEKLFAKTTNNSIQNIRYFVNKIRKVKSEIENNNIDTQKSYLSQKDTIEQIKNSYNSIIDKLENSFKHFGRDNFQVINKSMQTTKVDKVEKSSTEPNEIKPKAESTQNPLDAIFQSMSVDELLDKMATETNEELRVYYKTLISKKMA